MLYKKVARNTELVYTELLLLRETCISIDISHTDILKGTHYNRFYFLCISKEK